MKGKCPKCGHEITDEELGEGAGVSRRGRSAVETVALTVGWLFLILAVIALVPIVLAIVVGVAAWLLQLAVFVLAVVVLVVIVVKAVKWAQRSV